MPETDYQAIVRLIEEYWYRFTVFCDDDVDRAEKALEEMKRKAGMS